MNAYRRNQEYWRQAAIDWQEAFCEHDYSWGELAYYSALFTRMGRRYGLLEEFRENGIC